MTWLNDLFPQLTELELYEQQLVERLRVSPHITMLAKREFLMDYWQTSQLNFFVGPVTATYDSLLSELHIPTDWLTELNRKATGSERNWYWPTSVSYDERAEWIRAENGTLAVRYFTQRRHLDLQLAAPPLSAEQQAVALSWLAQTDNVRALVDGKPLELAGLKALGLIPVWNELTLTHSAKKTEVAYLAPGLRFLCRALALYPALLLIWRGVAGDEVIRRFVERELSQRQVDLESVRAVLPVSPAEFWALPELPAVPDPETVQPSEGLGEHLTQPDFWPKPDDNALFMSVMSKVYKNIPRKLKKLYETRRYRY